MSGKNYFVIERRAQKQKLLELIKKTPNMQEGRLKGLFSLRSGLSFRKIDEYLNELKEGNLIEQDEQGCFKVVE